MPINLSLSPTLTAEESSLQSTGPRKRLKVVALSESSKFSDLSIFVNKKIIPEKNSRNILDIDIDDASCRSICVDCKSNVIKDIVLEVTKHAEGNWGKRKDKRCPVNLDKVLNNKSTSKQ
jgi:hypothetical protein